MLVSKPLLLLIGLLFAAGWSIAAADWQTYQVVARLAASF